MATPSTATTAASSSAPSHIFVVRHGARLDAADKDWVESSPTPYDTPLTYGGWIQSRNLGTRIASLLHNDQHLPSAATSAPRKKRTRVVIHSSPFLRCIQTSISIASGLAQHHHQQVTDAYWSTDEAGQPCFKSSTAADDDSQRFVKPVLRLDAWLGEWMTMDYYADITPPPISQLMVANARNEYMRAPESIPVSTTKSPLLGAAAAAPSPATTGGFVPPSPVYAVSTGGSIPRGYVSHAKEYVGFDYGWDSMRIGTGAELDEEWSAMHRRFRNGYSRLMWYFHDTKPNIATSTTMATAATKKRTSRATTTTTTTTTADNIPTPPLSDSESEDDEDIDTVVILVTHGAGCNALLGAISDKPVLIDIGIGSLTMGVLCPTITTTSSSPTSPSSPFASSSSPASPSSPFAYNLKLSANTEHMRTPPISPYLTASPSLAPLTLDIKTQRSASASTRPRPTGLWTMPRPESRERGAEESAVVVVEEEAVDVVVLPVERSGSVVDGGETGKGLWTARAWDRPTRRRWTVGREAWNGGS